VDSESPALVERSSTDLPPAVEARLENLDAVIIPGVPGMTAERMGLEAEVAVFPSTTTDVMKVLRERSVEAEFDDPAAAHPLGPTGRVPLVIGLERPATRPGTSATTSSS